jgi:DNA-binding MarR family transcriptional regulator
MTRTVKLTDKQRRVLRQLVAQSPATFPTHFPECPPRQLCEKGLAVEVDQHKDSAVFRVTPEGAALIRQAEENTDGTD